MQLAVLEGGKINLEVTFGSGQAFHWCRDGKGWYGAIGEDAVYLEERRGVVHVAASNLDNVLNYLALDHPLKSIEATFPKDNTMCAAMRFCRGMRILRQPAWEATATFITSSMKKVAHIAQMSHCLRRRFGNRISRMGKEMWSYPRAEVIAGLEEKDLRECGLGYRAKHLRDAARMVASGEVDLEKVAQMEDADALRELCRLNGVGEKVGSCALLFGFERLKAFPVDVWIERVIREKYFGGRESVTAGEIRKFCAEYFGPYGGYAQQYLFHHARLTWNDQA